MRLLKIIENNILFKCCICWKYLPKEDFFKQSKDKYWITSSCKQCHILRNKYYRRWHKDEKNLERLKKYIIKRNQDHLNKYWYDRKDFHARSTYFVKKLNILPNVCPICWKDDSKVEIHHPCYETFDNRKDVVFCCSSCHRLIHNNKIQCPEPIDLLLINKNE